MVVSFVAKIMFQFGIVRSVESLCVSVVTVQRIFQKATNFIRNSGYQMITRGEIRKMGNISLNEALGRRESKLLSEAVNTEITISSVEMESGKDNTGKEFERAYINTVDGVTYRSSNKAVLTKAKAISSNLPKGSTVIVKVVQKKGKTGGYKYLDIESV